LSLRSHVSYLSSHRPQSYSLLPGSNHPLSGPDLCPAPIIIISPAQSSLRPRSLSLRFRSSSLRS
jgi:hypothetical protein